MPKRVLDGDAMWRSDKIAAIQHEWIKPEFAWLLANALANGSFECNPRLLWARCYAYARPEITSEQVTEILGELERVKLLVRWTDPSGKAWGYWPGIDKPGRLPSESRRGKNEAVGAEPPAGLLDPYANSGMEASGIHKYPHGYNPLPDGNKMFLGSGSGSGLGSGLGSGSPNEPFPTSENDCSQEISPTMIAGVSESICIPANLKEMSFAVQDAPEWEDAFQCALFVARERGLENNHLLIADFEKRIIGESARLKQPFVQTARQLNAAIQKRPNKGANIETWLSRNGGFRTYLDSLAEEQKPVSREDVEANRHKLAEAARAKEAARPAL